MKITSRNIDDQELPFEEVLKIVRKMKSADLNSDSQRVHVRFRFARGVIHYVLECDLDQDNQALLNELLERLEKD